MAILAGHQESLPTCNFIMGQPIRKRFSPKAASHNLLHLMSTGATDRPVHYELAGKCSIHCKAFVTITFFFVASFTSVLFCKPTP